MMWKPVKLLRLNPLLNWHRLFCLLIVFVLTACSKERSYGPLIVESPDFYQVVEYTNAITITFNIYSSSDGKEPMYRCPFYWAEGTKLIPGNCPSIPTGVYVYQLEYREKSNNQLLAKAEGPVNIDKTQGVVIQPTLLFNFDEDQDGKNNLDDFLCRLTPNTAPTAKAGPDLTMEVDEAVKLNGGDSSDTDCNNPKLKYLWTLIGPASSSASLSDSETMEPSFTPDVAGNYEITLMVNDGKVNSVVDTIIVTATTPAKPNSDAENNPPIAEAGDNQTSEAGQPVTLDGSGSTDANGDELSYLWTLTDPDDKTGVLTNSTSATPSFTPTVTGSYQASLVVNDGQIDSNISRVTITVIESPNLKPIAHAGIDQKAQVGDNITLDGSESSDADDDSLTYQWAVPSGLSSENSSAVKPTLTIPINTVAGTLIFSLVVEDSKGEKSDPDTVQITIINSIPVAHAGADQNAEVSDSIVLDASGSSDPNGDNLSYLWTSPEGIILSDTQVAKPSFTMANGSKAGRLSFFVTVSDNQGGTATDNVDIHVLNTAPKADAGIDRNLLLGETLTLNGQASTDVNEDNLTYQWILLTVPPSSNATMSNSDQVNASFTPEVIGIYTIELQVSDGLTNGNDLLTITVEQIKPQMVVIPEDSFQMGDESSPDGINQGSGESDEVPVHTVTIASFEIGKYEVTFDGYDRYLVSRGIDVTIITGGEAHDNSWGRGNHPIINVSWDDIQGYLDWLNNQLGIVIDDPKRYRLPTEAEWEYAARAGTITAYHTGDCIETSQANYNGEFGYSYLKKNGVTVGCPKTDLNQNKTLPVGNFLANDFGLHDMHGNVWEWIEDCLHDSYTSAPNDGTAWVTNCSDSRRILRGGAWDNQAMQLRSANRGRDSAINRRNFIGFRLARTL